ncbi:MAG TPA: cytochrome C oxidase subunit IV family protein [Rectinemataceae bacterium]|nr:cytochrome C oxidase subunit IV family protein [Rectinemataceae bacterium]
MSQSEGKTTSAAHPGNRSYLTVWGALVLLTALTVTMASLDLGALAIAAVLTIAAVKSSLVLFYFMHLRYERRLLIRLLMPIVLATLAIFIGLTYTDILYR